MSPANILDRLGKELIKGGFVRKKSRWFLSHRDVMWVTAGRRLFNGARLEIETGVYLRDRGEVEWPSINQCQVKLNYTQLSKGQPSFAEQSRYSGRASYFAVVLDSSSSLLPEEDQNAAIDYMGSEIVQVANSITTLNELADFILAADLEAHVFDREIRDVVRSRRNDPLGR